jgi:hypothetical protein
VVLITTWLLVREILLINKQFGSLIQIEGVKKLNDLEVEEQIKY